jgi:hypothetical protein
VVRFEFLNLARSHPEEPAFLPAGRGISRGTQHGSGDPSLRRKNGSAQDDAIDERTCLHKFKLHHYRIKGASGHLNLKQGIVAVQMGGSPRSSASLFEESLRRQQKKWRTEVRHWVQHEL